MLRLLTKSDLHNAINLIGLTANRIIPEEINRTKVSVWAQENRTLKEGPLQGAFSFSFTPFLREIADRLSPSDPCREVVVMKGTRLGATVGVGENWIGATIDAFPCEMAYITSGGDMAGAQMDLRVDSLINNSGIAEKIGNVEKRETQKKTGDRNVRKNFPGGYLMAGGPKAQFIKRAFGFKQLYIDEVDAFQDNIDKEGDPVALYRRRVDTYPDSSKILWTSSPLFKHNSKIYSLYKEGDQRKFFVPCKDCGHMQFLRWGKKDKPGGLKFEHTEDDKLVEGSVYYECEECGSVWTNADKDIFLAKGQWRPTEDRPRNPQIKSYHLPQLYSPIGFRSWESGVRQFLEIKHEGFPILKFQNWVNTFLGEPFENRTERPKIERLLQRSGEYNKGNLPKNAKPLFLTAWADVQKDRIECEIVAHGKNFVTWSVDYLVFYGDTADESSSCYTKFASAVAKSWAGHNIILAGIDAGYNTNIASSFCDNVDLPIYTTMGFERISKLSIKMVALPDFAKSRIEINTAVFKEEIYNNLAKSRQEDGTYPRGFMHFPQNYDRKYYNMLTAEDKVREVKNGVVKIKWDEINVNCSTIFTPSKFFYIFVAF